VTENNTKYNKNGIKSVQNERLASISGYALLIKYIYISQDMHSAKYLTGSKATNYFLCTYSSIQLSEKQHKVTYQKKKNNTK
jgi:hypothetical protein